MSKNLMAPIVRDSMKEFANELRPDRAVLGRMKVLMTGGTGFYGSWILASFAALREAGIAIEMTVLSRNADEFRKNNPLVSTLPGLTFASGDVVSAEVPRGTTHVFHFATTPTDRLATGEDAAAAELAMRRTIVAGTKNMLNEAIRVKAKRFLLASSGAVYGSGGTDRPMEDALILPSAPNPSVQLSVYGAAKRDAENLCVEATRAGKIETIVARGFSFGGPLFPMDAPYALSSFMSAMLRGEKIEVKSPQTVRSYLDGRDLVRAMWALLLHGRAGETYNVGSDESVTMAGLAREIQIVAENIGLTVPEIVLSDASVVAANASKADVYHPKIEKLLRHLGWKPQISLRTSLKDYAEWAKA